MDPLIIDELGSYSGVERTSSGGWSVPATLTRTGLFKYVENGKPITVLRPKEEVFSDASLESLALCPVTVFHPAEREVTPKNYRRVVTGLVGKPTVLADKYVAARLRIEDEETGNKIDNKELCEVSCGYRADYARNPDGSFVSGTYNGEHYDRMQINIRYNHVSLGPKGWGRAGSDVGIKLDGSDTAYVSGMDNVSANQLVNDEADAPPAPPAPVVDSAAASLRAELDKVTAERDLLKATLAAPKPAPAAPVIDQAAVAARAALIADAKVLAPTLACDSLTDAEIRTLALAPTLKVDGKSEAYINAAFDMAVAQRKVVLDSHTNVRAAVLAPVVDAKDPVAEAQAACWASYGRKPSATA